MAGMKDVTQASHGRGARASTAWLSSTRLSHGRPVVDPQGLAFMRCPTVEEGMADSLDWQPQGLSSYGAASCGRGGTTSTGLKALGKPFPRGDLSCPQGSSVSFLALQSPAVCSFAGLSPESIISPEEPAVEETVTVSPIWYPWVSSVLQRLTVEEGWEAPMDWLPSSVVEEGAQLPLLYSCGSV